MDSKTRRTSTLPSTNLFYSNSNDHHNNENDRDDTFFDVETLQARIVDLRLQLLEQELQRPPRVGLSPSEFVKALLDGVYHNDDPRPDAGFDLLLRCSTTHWAAELLQSIGAPTDYKDFETAASALGHAMTRPHNQFAILTGSSSAEDNDDDDEEEEEDNDGDDKCPFSVVFPSETLDFMDGTAWCNVELHGPLVKD